MSKYAGTLESIPKQSKQLIDGLSESAKIVATVADLVKKSYTDLPTSGKAVGLVESMALTEAREQMTKSLVLYREFHLPLSITMVSDLVRTLDYFENDYEEFKPLLPFAQKQVKEAEERANFVHDMFFILSVDLEKLGEDAEKALKAAEIAAQQNSKSAEEQGKLARRVGYGGTTVAGVVVTAGFVLACGLTGPGGLLFAPALALPAFAASSTVAGVGASMTAIVARELKEQSNQKQIIANSLKESGKIYETVLVGALKKFADCMKHVVSFFVKIKSKLENVDKNMCDLGDDDRSHDELRALYDVIRRQSSDLRKACDLYLTRTTGTKVAIGVLSRFENENCRSYIDDWYNTCSSELKLVPSTKSLLKKVVPNLKALHS